MELVLTDEQKLLRDSAARLIERRAGPAQHRALREDMIDLLLTQLVSTESPGKGGNAPWANKRNYLKEAHRGSL